jgi:hypothetical protein
MNVARLVLVPVLCGALVALGFAFGSGRWHLPRIGGTGVVSSALNGQIPRLTLSGPPRMERPYGMAPEAFRAYIRACNNAKVHPWRIGQTIGSHPRSVGYHHKDGTIIEDGVRYDYTAAIDLGGIDLSDARRKIFLEALARQGFAAFWRASKNWKGNEHIHAIYCLIPMKPQLRGQVLEWVEERRDEGKPRLRWIRKLRRSKQFRAQLS